MHCWVHDSCLSQIENYDHGISSSVKIKGFSSKFDTAICSWCKEKINLAHLISRIEASKETLKQVKIAFDHEHPNTEEVGLFCDSDFESVTSEFEQDEFAHKTCARFHISRWTADTTAQDHTPNKCKFCDKKIYRGGVKFPACKFNEDKETQTSPKNNSSFFWSK